MQQDQIRFLVATDVHLGHKEKHVIRKNDSFEGLEEVFENARKHEVDFLLLGGDLFDQVNPSKECYFRCMNIFGDNIFGKREVNLEVTQNGEKYKCNFTNRKVNISLPVFTIHGNHDYPNNQFGKISICDLLHQSNYVNYFGKQLSLHKILIRPLIITKKNCKTKIALYGLGYIKDPILNDLFEHNNAQFEKPIGDLSQYFTVFIFHQNRYKKKFKPGVPLANAFRQENIPDWINLTIWGHEHEAIYQPQIQNEKTIFQPGSTVITSLIGAEALKKQCALVKVKLKSYKIESVLLEKSFRPMFCITHEVKKLKDEEQGADLFRYLDEEITNILEESVKINPLKKPIIRIKLDYSNLEELIRFQNIEIKYVSCVANPEKIFVTCKRKDDKLAEGADKAILDSLKNKKIVPNIVGYSAAFNSLLKEQLSTDHFQLLTPQFMEQLPLLLDNQQAGSINNLIDKEVKYLQEREDKEVLQKITRFMDQNLLELKKTLKYRLEAKAAIMGDESFTNDAFQKGEAELMSSQKYLYNSKLIEEQLKLKPSAMINNQMDQSTIMKNQVVNRSPRLIKTEFISVSERSDSEDCCERASKQSIDQQRNKSKFYQAKLEMEKINNLKLKQDAHHFSNKHKSKPPPKKVKYSTDFK